MRRHWDEEGLAACWTLSEDEFALLRRHARSRRLGMAAQLKFFQIGGRFPRTIKEIPIAGLEFLAGQLKADPKTLLEYDLQGRNARRHKHVIRDFFGFRPGTMAYATQLRNWLGTTVLPFEQRLQQLEMAASEWCQEHRVFPSRHFRVDRVVRSAIREYEADFQERTYRGIPLHSRTVMDALLATSAVQQADQDAVEGGFEASAFAELKIGSGRATLKSAEREVARLQCIDALQLPEDLFSDAAQKLVQTYRRRAGAEPPRELRNHSEPVRYTLVAAFAWQRHREVIDGLAELLIQIVHKIDVRAERRVVQVLVQDIRAVRGKGTVL